MTPSECNRNSDNRTTFTKEKIEVNQRGIRNVSRVSCHVACAIQILCHAIPSVRSALARLAAEEVRTEQNGTVDRNEISSGILLEELIDFVRVTNLTEMGVGEADQEDEDACNCSGEKSKQGSFVHPNPWNPERLYKYLHHRSGSLLAINPYDVGDATRSLSCLLRLLSQEGTCSGPSWKALLDASVWEGETLQILEGRLPLKLEGETILAPEGEDVKVKSLERRFLQRTKPATKNKAMSSPLVLKFSPQRWKGASSNRWSVMEALKEIEKPKRIQGSSYQWESVSPDMYSEKEIVCRRDQNRDDNSSKPGAESRTNSSDSDKINVCDGVSGTESDSDDESDSDVAVADSTSDSDSDSEDDSDCSDSDNSDYNNWSTSKRLKIKRIPRVFLLHLDRPVVSMNKLRRSLMLSTMESNKEENHGENFSLIDHVLVPIELNPSLISTTNGGAFESDFADKSTDGDGSNYKDELQSPSTNLFLRGAIVQVVELDDCDDDSTENEEDSEGGHSITLLRNSNADASSSWLLVDDDKTLLVSEERAVRMLGGVLENKVKSSDSDVDSGWAYFAASLLVYSIPEDGDDFNEWGPYENDIVSSWREHKKQQAATVASQGAFVGKRIRVKWAKGKFYSGTVTRYYVSAGKHQVTYDDGDVKVYNLARKTIEWID